MRRSQGGTRCVEQPQQAIRVGSGVDQHSAALRSLEQDRVALAHVEHGHVEPAVRTSAADEGQHQRQPERSTGD